MIHQWVCPKCGWKNLDYSPIEFEDQCWYFPWECKDCEAVWEEWYWLDFSWHYNVYDKDGNEIWDFSY